MGSTGSVLALGEAEKCPQPGLEVPGWTAARGGSVAAVAKEPWGLGWAALGSRSWEKHLAGRAGARQEEEEGTGRI